MKVPTPGPITLLSVKPVAFLWVVEFVSTVWAVSTSFPVYTEFYMFEPPFISMSTHSLPDSTVRYVRYSWSRATGL